MRTSFRRFLSGEQKTADRAFPGLFLYLTSGDPGEQSFFLCFYNVLCELFECNSFDSGV